ncbi:MAG: hypothetical protein WBZ07_03075 [Candidatus Dormiibacterota bacterium]
MPGSTSGLSATEFLQVLDSALVSIPPSEVTKLAGAWRPVGKVLLEQLVRDRGFLALLEPGQIMSEPGVDLDTLDLSVASTEGLDQVLTAIIEDLPGVWEQLRTSWMSRPERAHVQDKPLASFAALRECLSGLLVSGPAGKRYASLPILLAVVEHFVDGVEGSSRPAVGVTEVLAIADAALRASANQDVYSIGGTQEAVAAASRGNWLDQVHAAALQTHVAIDQDPERPSLTEEQQRLAELSRQTRTQFRRTAEAETPEALGLPARTKSVVTAPSFNTGTVQDLADKRIAVEQEAIAKDEAARLRRAVYCARLTEIELELILGLTDRIPNAQFSRRLGISEAAGRQHARRARKKVAAYLESA